MSADAAQRKQPSTEVSKAGAGTAPEDGTDACVHACVEPLLTTDELSQSIAAAIDERADNWLPQPFALPMMAEALSKVDGGFMAIITKKAWRKGRVLKVLFKDKPTPRVRDMIVKYAKSWEMYANIIFEFVEVGLAEIRIKLDRSKGSYSYLGTDALTRPQTVETMNFGWFTDSTPEDEFRRTVIHEFGHALGCIHEHSSPEAAIPWNKEAVYAYYWRTQRWSRADVDAQVFAKYSATMCNSTKYDSKSIMHYPIPPEHVTDPRAAVGWNTDLSPLDKTFIATMYPKA